MFNLLPGSAWGGVYEGPFVRYFPFLLIFISFLWQLIFSGLPLFLFRSFFLFCALVVFVFMFAGGFYALLNGADLKDTYVGRSFSLFIILAAAYFAYDQPNLERYFNLIFPALVFFSCLGILTIILHALGIGFQNYPHILREEGVVFFGVLLAYARVRRNFLILIFLAAFCIVEFALLKKATYSLLFLVLIVVSFGAFPLRWFTALQTNGVVSLGLYRIFLVIVGALVLACLLYFGFEVVSERAGRSEHGLRVRMWLYRIEQIKLNPIWGQFFVETPLYSEYLLPGRALPTHNDLLDIGAAGGLPVLLLFVSVLFSALMGPLGRNLFLGRHGGGRLRFELPWCLVLSCCVTFLGNPVLNNPRISFFFMSAIGFVLIEQYKLKRNS